jgi:hypothetical protein
MVYRNPTIHSIVSVVPLVGANAIDGKVTRANRVGAMVGDPGIPVGAFTYSPASFTNKLCGTTDPSVRGKSPSTKMSLWNAEVKLTVLLDGVAAAFCE